MSTNKDGTQCEPMTAQQQSELDRDIYRTEAKLFQLNEIKELREAARPLIEYLKRKYDLHTSAIVDGTSVKIVQDLTQVIL